MALELCINICEKNDCKAIGLSDCTDIFDSVTNVGGYGGNNPDFGDLLTAVVRITLPDAEDYIQINVGGVLPNTDDTEKIIFNTDLGLGADDKLPDGVWTFEYIITGVFNTVPFTESITEQAAFTCRLECCKDKKNSLINIQGKDCKTLSNDDKKLLDEASLLENLLINIQYNMDCDKPNQAGEIIKFAQNICDCGC